MNETYRGLKTQVRRVAGGVPQARKPQEKFAGDFAAAWAKVMHADRFDLA